jgi:hypothetical protein
MNLAAGRMMTSRACLSPQQGLSLSATILACLRCPCRLVGSALDPKPDQKVSRWKPNELNEYASFYDVAASADQKVSRWKPVGCSTCSSHMPYSLARRVSASPLPALSLGGAHAPCGPRNRWQQPMGHGWQHPRRNRPVHPAAPQAESARAPGCTPAPQHAKAKRHRPPRH